MLRKAEIHKVGPPNKGENEFNDYRNTIIKEFYNESPLFKRKMTQGAFWTAFDQELAIQFFRDERWLFGLKFWDAMKFIDHGISENAPPVAKRKPGFINQ